MESSKRRQMVGVVVSDRMTKTLVVQVARLVRHRVYSKVVRRFKSFKVHDPAGEAHAGDEVLIEETRPISKEKRWRLIKILRRGMGIEDKEASRVAELEEMGVLHKKQDAAGPVSPAQPVKKADGPTGLTGERA